MHKILIRSGIISIHSCAHKAEYLVAQEAEVPDAEEAQEDGEVRVEGRAEEVPVYRTLSREELVHEAEAVREREGHQARRAADRVPPAYPVPELEVPV